jgi:hypothetical protein
VTDSGTGWIVRVVAREAALDALSVKRMVKLAVPATDGVPLIWPAELSVKPAGSAPAAIDHVYGGVPPLAATFCE